MRNNVHQHLFARHSSSVAIDECEMRTLLQAFGADTFRQAEALLDRSERFFGLVELGKDMQGSAMHQTLLAAYDKLFA